MIRETRRLQSQTDLDAFVAELETFFRPRTIVLLEGEVGAGKTETVRALARRRGWQAVASPSYAIHLRYEDAAGRGADHLDLYRLESEDDLESTGFWDLFAEPEGLILLEWADRLDPSYLPANWFQLRVRLEKGAMPEERIVTIEEVVPSS